MRDVVRHISVFSCLDDEPRLTRVNVATALDMAIEMGNSEHVLRLRVVKLFDDVPDVEANPEQLAHALLSLLVAAAHSCEDGDPQRRELRVLIRREADEVVVEVGDSRSGPHTKRGDETLDPFPSVPRDGNGSGLGLSLCATVVAAFAGRVLVGRGGGRFIQHERTLSREADQSALRVELYTLPVVRIFGLDGSSLRFGGNPPTRFSLSVESRATPSN